MDISSLTILKARRLLDSKELSVKELSNEYIKNIEANNKKINAYLGVFDDIDSQSEKSQKIIDSGSATSLTGIPFAVKDNILIKGRKAGAASKILENYVAPYSATAIQKLESEGVIFLGRANMDEFAMGGSTENSAYGPTHNPHDTQRVAGGSSGGSAAAVAADMALAALGSDTGGSVREPASFCGIVGLKPTYGSVSRYGLMAMGSSLDVIGTMGKTVEDTEIIFNSIKGRDRMDSTSIDESVVSPKNISEKIRIGIPYDLINQDGISNDVRKNFDESVSKLKNLGFEIKDIKLPNIDKSLAVYYIIMPAEVSSNMSRYDGVKFGLRKEGENLLEVYKKSRGEGFGPEVRRRIILGTYVLSTGYYDAYYGKALALRDIIRSEFDNAFKDVDAIITPTAPTPAWKIGEKTSPLEEYLADIFTVTANIVGIPAISIPSGFSNISGKDLPLGLQIMAPYMSENILFKIGKDFLNG